MRQNFNKSLGLMRFLLAKNLGLKVFKYRQLMFNTYAAVRPTGVVWHSVGAKLMLMCEEVGAVECR
jgi:hypothetical protein